MRKLAAAIPVAAGALLAIVPRFVLPPCGWGGGMHCASTARAEIGIGVLLVAVGAVALSARRSRLVIATAAASIALLAAAWVLPDVIGYCASPRMPCHYGMVPAIRLIATIAGVALIAAAAPLAGRARQGEAP